MARTVRVYRDTDASAPVLTGVAGSFTSLLDAVLVAGYGALTAAGWTTAFTAASLRAYRNDPTDGTGTYYRVRDDLTTTNQKWAYVTMYEVMTAVSTGTNPYPLTDNFSGVQKSNTQDATARPWVIIADNCAAHIFIKAGDNGTEWEWYFMGDMFSFKSADIYRGFVSMRGNNSSNINALTFSNNVGPVNRQLSAVSQGMAVVRIHAATGLAQQCGAHTDTAKINSAFTSAQNAYFGNAAFQLAYPNAVNSGLLLAPIWIHQNTTAPYIVRGYLPGLWSPLHSRPLANNDTFSGASGALAGKTFEAFHIPTSGQLFVETSNTWS